VEDVVADVRAGYVSPQAALRDYGVEVDTTLWVGKRLVTSAALQESAEKEA
jgi:hypothetical protein